jgi:hypothetical protein
MNLEAVRLQFHITNNKLSEAISTVSIFKEAVRN